MTWRRKSWEMGNPRDWCWYVICGYARTEWALAKAMGWVMETQRTRFPNLTDDEHLDL